MAIVEPISPLAVVRAPAAPTTRVFVPDPQVSQLKPPPASKAAAQKPMVPIELPAISSIAQDALETELQSRLDSLRGEAEATGIKRGMAAGRETVEREWRERLQRFDQLLSALRLRRDDLLEDLETDIATVVEEAVARVFGALSADPPAVLEAVRRAIAGVRDRSTLTVRIAPAHLDLIGEALSQLGEIASGRVQIIGDAAVGEGSCLIETPRGTLDAGLGVQFEQLMSALRLAGPISPATPSEST